MQLLNDKKERAEQERPEVGLLSLISHALFSAVGISTLLLGPLSMLYAAWKLVTPWPQATALFGAIIALTFLDVPLVFVLVSFVVGILVVDAVSNSRPLWLLLGMVILVGAILGVGIAWGGASFARVGLLDYWNSSVAETLANWRDQAGLDHLAIGSAIDWDNVQSLLFYEGPFLYLSFLLFSVWIGVGVAAHAGWWAVGHAYSASALRELRLNRYFGLSYLALVVASLFVHSEYDRLVSGVLRVAGVFLFIQGSIVLSGILDRKGMARGTKTLVYVVVVLIGYYFAVGLGIFQSWVETVHSNRKRFQSNPLELTRVEEVV